MDLDLDPTLFAELDPRPAPCYPLTDAECRRADALVLLPTALPDDNTDLWWPCI